MRKSEIFESFIKIAQDRGLVSKDAPEKAIKQLSKTHRHDALSAEDIGKLYNVKPNRPEDMDYEHNIMEDAHPDSLVISPAYDKLNGLIENENERKNIILNIVNKQNNGQLTNHKYAEKELILNLVRLGNDLDNKNKDELRALADACLNQVSVPPIKKEAVGALAIGLIVGIPLLLGALYAQQHMKFANEGFKANHAKLIAELDDLIESNANWEVGYRYRPEFIQEMQNFKNQLTDVYASVIQNSAIIDQIEKPKDAKELIAIAQQPESASVMQAYKALRAKIANFTPYIKKIITDFGSEDYKARQIEEKGALTSLVDKTQVLHGGKGFIADDFDDVVRALAPYRASLLEIIKVLRGANSVEQKSKQELQEAATEFQNDYGIDAPGQPSGNSPETGDIAKQVSDLFKQVPKTAT